MSSLPTTLRSTTRALLLRCDDRDRGWSRRLQQGTARAVVRRTLTLVSRLSDGCLWYTTMLLLPWLGGPRGTACTLRMVAVGALNLLFYKLLKRRVARPRPFVACADIQACARTLDEYSFPSGHAMHAVSFSILLATYYPAWSTVLWPFTVLVALSRVTLGLHYPSDVVVGALLGAATTWMALALF
ncbi:MAG: phosphatase PAP2 family protein [Burkholderiaceae bacterium]